MKNLRELFNLYHAGFQDFGPWLDHHREMHRRHPLDVPEFGAEWLRRWKQQNEQQATLYLRGRYPAWRIDARGTVSEMLERGEKRSQAKGLVMYRYAVKVVDGDGVIIKQWDKNRP